MKSNSRDNVWKWSQPGVLWGECFRKGFCAFSRPALSRLMILAISGILATSLSTQAQTVSDLGTAQTFTILGGSAVTSTGATIINGNLGVSPGTSITGFPPGIVINGSIFNNVAPATTAHADTQTAFNMLAGLPSSANLTSVDLGGLTLTPGVYTFASSAGLTGVLTLDNTLDPTGAYVFQIGTGLTTATNSAVILLGGANPNVFWQIGTSATIGTATQFEGNILALTSITFDPGATLSTGRALSINGAVTMSGGNSINLNAPGAPLVAEGAFWNGSASNLWSDMNWSPDTTGAVTGTLPTGADVVFSVTGIAPLNQNTTLDFNALISSLTINDTAAVSITGANTLTILGAAAATETLTVNAGAGLATINSSLVLGGLSQGITVDNAAGLVINGTVSGLLGLTKGGSGVLTLNGTNTYTGGTTINAGALAVGSAGALGTGSVANNATLETTASVGGAVQTINVNGAYTQTLGGILLLQVVTSPAPTPSLNTGVAGTNYDTLQADGTATLAGTLTLNFAGSAVPFQGQHYVALTAGAPLLTPFTASTTTNLDPSFLAVTTYNNTFGGTEPDNSAIVTLLRPFASIRPLTPNQTSVARYIDKNITFLNNNGSLGMATGANADFFNNIVMGLSTASNTPHALGLALNELSPQRFEIFHNIAFDNYAFDVQNLDEELARERHGNGGFDASGFTFNDSQIGSQLSGIKSRLLAWSPAPSQSNMLSDSGSAVYQGLDLSDSNGRMKTELAAAEPAKKWNAFIDGGADLGDLEHNADVSHSSYTTGRVRVGADYLVATNLRAGALIGYSGTDAKLDNHGSKAQIDSFTPGLFMGYGGKQGFYANGLLTYTRNEYQTDRRIIFPGVDRTADGTTGGNQFGGNLDGGYEFRRGNWLFGPNIGLSYVNLNIDDFTETGAGAASLNVHNQSADSLRSRVGGTVSYRAQVGSVALTPHMSAFWQHEYLNEDDNITAQFAGLPAATGNFAIQTRRGDRDTALLGFGLDADICDNVTLFINYGAVAGGKSFFGQSATAGVKLAF